VLVCMLMLLRGCVMKGVDWGWAMIGGLLGAAMAVSVSGWLLVFWVWFGG